MGSMRSVVRTFSATQNQNIFCAYKEAHLPAPISQYACAEVATAARVNKSCIGESERAV